jgi:predicted nucleotidyltransferase
MEKINKKNITKTEIISFLQSNKDYLNEKYGVISIGLIGSYAREEQKDDSDIDFLVEFDKVSFDKLAGLYIFLENNLQKKLDIIIKSSYLRKRFRDIVEREAIYA